MAKRISIGDRQAEAKKSAPPPVSSILSSKPQDGLVLVAPETLEPNPFQPRDIFDEDKLQELADSIAQDGIIEPIIARPKEDGYQIVAGERRWRAAQLSKLKTVPIVIRDCSDEEMELLALEENLHREDLNSVARGKALKSLKAKLNLTWEQLGKRVGLTRRRVLMLAGLTDLPEEVQTQVEQGILTEKHTRAITRLKKPAQQKAFIKAIQRENLSGDRAISAARIIQEDPTVSIASAVQTVARSKPKTTNQDDAAGVRARTVGKSFAESIFHVQAEKLSSKEKKLLAADLELVIATAQELIDKLRG